MVAALENFALMPVKNKVVILGDMLELGNLSEQEHVELILNLADKSFDKIILVGDEFENALSLSGKNYQHFATVAQLKDWFDQQQFSDCFFLLKGSRLIGLEKLLM
jgi:UDP-N-acetylmuramoyl-tripeptide--D-alanyl-D-alanine ligase